MLFGCATAIEQYEKISHCGYDYIELSAQKIINLSAMEFKDTQLKLRRGSLFCSGFNDFCNQHLPLVGADVNKENIMEHTKKVCERASELGATQIGVGGPQARLLQADFSLEKAQSQIVENLFEMGRIAQDYQCQILWESLSNCHVDVSVKEAARTVKLVNSSEVRLVVDFFHMRKNKESLSDLFDVKKLIAHLHISGENRVGRTYLEKNDPWWDYYVSIATVLKEINYKKTISVETAIPSSSKVVLMENLKIMNQIFHF